MIGIIILNYNTWKETEECITSIRRYTTIPYTVYVVDNCSKDDSTNNLERIYKEAKDVRLIFNNDNKGYSAGNNIGIKKAEEDGCDTVFIVNSDVELLNDAFAIMTNTLHLCSDYMMIGPSVMDNNGNESQLPRYILTPSIFLLERHPFCLIPLLSKRADRIVKTDERPMAFTGSVSGCCFGIRTDDIKKAGYLDEGVFLYYEEDILGYKIKAFGKKAVFENKAKVWHKANISTKKEGGAFVQFHRWTSVLYMLKKYANISMPKQIGIAAWNILTWDLISLYSIDHRKMRRRFRRKNLELVRIK